MITRIGGRPTSRTPSPAGIACTGSSADSHPMDSSQAQGNSIPGFGSARSTVTGVVTLNETHIFCFRAAERSPLRADDAASATRPAAPLNPAELGIGDGVTRPIGLPQIIVAGDLNFGGPAPFPQGRDDALYVVGDTLTQARGRHTIKAGGEYRHFINSNFAQGTGVVQFSERGRVPCRHGQRLHHHARRATQRHRRAGDVAVLAGRDQRRRPAHGRARAALRVARDADRTRQPLRRVRRGERVACCASVSTPARSIARTTQHRTARRRRVDARRKTAARCCAPRTAAPSTSRARRRFATPRATRRSARR